jgi:hypothetical protein
LVAPVAAYRLAIEPWWTYRSGLVETLAAERDVYARELAAIRDAQGASARLADLDRELATANAWLLQGTSELAVSGALTRALPLLARSAGVLLQEIRAGDVAPLAESRLAEVPVTVRLLGDLEGIVQLLHQLENHERLLHVRDLNLRPAGVNDGDLERGQLMSAGFTVVGFWRTPEPETAGQ